MCFSCLCLNGKENTTIVLFCEHISSDKKRLKFEIELLSSSASCQITASDAFRTSGHLGSVISSSCLFLFSLSLPFLVFLTHPLKVGNQIEEEEYQYLSYRHIRFVHYSSSFLGTDRQLLCHKFTWQHKRCCGIWCSSACICFVSFFWFSPHSGSPVPPGLWGRGLSSSLLSLLPV